MSINNIKGGRYEEETGEKTCKETCKETEILAHRKFTGRKIMVITLAVMFIVLIGFVFGIIIKYQNENVIIMVVQGLFSTIASIVSIIGMFAMYYTGQKKKEK